jgi:hypothetical protein
MAVTLAANDGFNYSFHAGLGTDFADSSRIRTLFPAKTITWKGLITLLVQRLGNASRATMKPSEYPATLRLDLVRGKLSSYDLTNDPLEASNVAGKDRDADYEAIRLIIHWHLQKFALRFIELAKLARGRIGVSSAGLRIWISATPAGWGSKAWQMQHVDALRQSVIAGASTTHWQIELACNPPRSCRHVRRLVMLARRPGPDQRARPSSPARQKA